MRAASLVRGLSSREMAVAKALQQHGRPMGAYELVEQLRNEGINAPTTVYRALSRLMKMGVVHRLESLNAYVWCWRGQDCPRGSVVFAICDSCGSVTEFDESEIGRRLTAWASDASFSVEQTTIELRGKCRTCGPAASLDKLNGEN